MYQYTAWGDASAKDAHGVVDGDTLHVGIDLGIDISTHVTLRLYGINAPEMSTPEGKQAKQFVIDWIEKYCPSGAFIVETVKDKREKYGRYLADVFSDESHTHWLNSDLLDAGLAVKYYPKTLSPSEIGLADVELPTPYGVEVDE